MPDFFQLNVGQSVQSERKTWYRNVQFLGMGGNAITYLVLCTSGPYKGVPFALKVFRAISRAERKDKFLAERKFLETSCNHPSILRVFDSGIFRNAQGEEFPFVVSEYLPLTLREIIRSQSTTIVEKISYVLQLLSALIYLDSLPVPVVHRDLKPENIFLKGQSCALGDFGLMKLLDGQDEVDREIFKESVGPGMPYFYRTPDLIAYARKESGISTKSDVFQLGLVAAELFTGRNPAVAPPNNDLLSPLVLEDLKWIQGALGSEIARTIYRMLVVKPSDREAAKQLIDTWQGIFENAVNRAHDLEGRAL
jgi:serine/threonine-protein kinase